MVLHIDFLIHGPQCSITLVVPPLQERSQIRDGCCLSVELTSGQCFFFKFSFSSPPPPFPYFVQQLCECVFVWVSAAPPLSL